VWHALQLRCFKHQELGPWVVLSRPHLRWIKTNMRIANNCHTMKTNHVLLVHILQYLLIIWSKNKVIIIRERGMTFTLGRHFLVWNERKWNSSLNSFHENLSLHPRMLHSTKLTLKSNLLGLIFYFNFLHANKAKPKNYICKHKFIITWSMLRTLTS